jgi:hypothetical protein
MNGLFYTHPELERRRNMFDLAVAWHHLQVSCVSFDSWDVLCPVVLTSGYLW